VNRRTFLRTLAAGAVGGLGLTAYGLASPYHHVVTRRAVALRGLREPLRVAVLADLHLGIYTPEQAKGWVASANAERPDLIVLPGDITQIPIVEEGDRSFLARLLGPLADLRAPLGAFAVLGNHDYQSVGRISQAAYAAALAAMNVRLLVNSGIQVRPDFFLTGLDDLWLGIPDLKAALSGAGGGALVLLAHNPDFLPSLPERVDLALFGHTHGGQVVLPFIGAPHVPSRYGNRFASGLFTEPRLAYVSRGLGTTAFKVRINCPPELAILNLTPG
jgi:predicted MPP superfamily phosphohydrolase